MIKETGNEQYDARAREDCPLPAWDAPLDPTWSTQVALARYKKSSVVWAKSGKKVGETTVRVRKTTRIVKK